MDDVKVYINEAEEKMEFATLHLEEALSRIRAGKANVHILDCVRVSSYGSEMPLNNVATITTPDLRTIAIKPWDKNMIAPIEKAIIDSPVGIMPANNGEVIIIAIPPLTGERRKDLVKEVKQLHSELEKEEKSRQKIEFEEKIINLPMTTTNNFEGYKIVKYIKVVSEEIIFKNSFWKRLDAGLEDLGNAFSFKQTEMSGASELIANAREYALEKFKRKVAKLGANAVVGVEFESSFGSDVVRVAIFGTAVIISEYESQ